MAILKTEALVLKTFDFRETSIIAHFYTRGFGRLNGILKGIRSDPKKFGSTLEPFSANEIVFYHTRNSDLHLVSQCDLLDNYSAIRADLKAIACACYLIDLVRHLMPQEEKNEQVYALISFALAQLNQNAEVDKVLRIFIIKLLRIIGFKPRLDGCVLCDGVISETAYFSVKRGGLLCRRCAPGEGSSSDVLKGTIASILHMEESSWQQALRLGLTGRIREELHRLISSFIEFHLQVKPRSKEFLSILT